MYAFAIGRYVFAVIFVYVSIVYHKMFTHQHVIYLVYYFSNQNNLDCENTAWQVLELRRFNTVC